MATEAACCPRGVTDLAIHRAVVMRESQALVVAAVADRGAGVNDPGYSAPGFSVAPQRFRLGGLRFVMRREGINRVVGLRHFPAEVGRIGGWLPESISFPSEPRPERRVAVI